MIDEKDCLWRLNSLDDDSRSGAAAFVAATPDASVLKDGKQVCEHNSLSVWDFIDELREFANTIESMTAHTREECHNYRTVRDECLRKYEEQKAAKGV